MDNYLCIPIFWLGQLEGKTRIQVSVLIEVRLCMYIMYVYMHAGVWVCMYLCMRARVSKKFNMRHVEPQNQFCNKKGRDREDHA